jgi:hypothetical protein
MMSDDAGQNLDFAQFARTVLDALDATGVEYLIGGAVAVWAWGDVRTTRDLDAVIELLPEAIPALSRELEKRGMLVPVDIILDVVITPGGDLPINAIHMYSGYKAELFLLRAGDDFRAEAMRRRLLADLGPPLGQVWVHSPEDLILYKLRYFSISRQSKHVRDIAGILTAIGDELDYAYLSHWVERLGLTDVWREVQAEAGLA